MKANNFLFFFVLVLTGFKSYGQITLRAKKMPLEKVFEHIQQQTGYTFFYDSEDVEGRIVNINVVNVPLDTVLSICLHDTPISFEIVNKTVILTKKESPRVTDTTFQISGAIVNYSTGQPVPYASIGILHSRKGMSADANGKFQLSGLRHHDVIEIRSIGFIKAVLPLSRLTGGLSVGDTITINEANVLLTKTLSYKVGLKQATTSLDEAIIVAYGTTTQRYDVGSVSVVKAKEIEQHPVSNVLEVLQGLVPGLNITVTSGSPGASTLAQVRGQNTLLNAPTNNTLPAAYNQPLYIVDGVPFSIQTNNLSIGSLASIGNGRTFFQYYSGLSPLTTINPADIASITVLKDADATSIYGSQGSNGAIMITTKRGKTGPDRIDFTINNGITAATRTPQMMNTAQYLAMRNEAIHNSAYTPNTYFDADLTLYDPKKYTDFSKQFYGATAHRTDIHLTLSGGSENTNYLISGGSTVQQYNFPGNFADKRLTLHSVFTHKSKDKKLNIDFGTDYTYDTNNSMNEPKIFNAFTLAPNTPTLVDPNGNPIWTYKGLDPTYYTTQSNPWALLKLLANTNISNVNAHLQTGYQLLPTLRFSVDGGYNRVTNNNHTIDPISSMDPRFLGQGSAAFSNYYSEMISLEPQLNFVKIIGRGTLKVLLGGTYWKNDGGGTQIIAQGYSSDGLLNSVNGASNTLIYDNSSIYKYLAVFSRINYLWDSKYILNLTGNRNGSSNFGPDRKYGNFGSVGLGWIISEESFIRKSLSFISYAKLSANYGTSGSDGIAPYQYQANWRQTVGFGTYQGFTGLSPITPENPTYGWSVNKKLNESLDLGFLNNRIVLNFTVYQNKASDQLVVYQEPITTGFKSITANAPYRVENKGVEVAVTSKNMQGNFKWATNFNIAHNANKLTDFPGLASSPYAGYEVLGKPVGGQLVVPYIGVNPATGLFNYRKKDGTIVFKPDVSPGINGLGGDATQYIDLQPKFSGGLTNVFSYKAFSLSVFFQFTKQTGQNYKYGLYSVFNRFPGNAAFNVPVQLLSRWQKPGDVSTFQRLSAGIYSRADNDVSTAALAFASSSGAYSDASYIRIKNVAFAYTLPQSLLKKCFIKDCAFYINAENLLTITGYKVGDPETQTLYEVPPQRIVIAGVNLNF